MKKVIWSAIFSGVETVFRFKELCYKKLLKHPDYYRRENSNQWKCKIMLIGEIVFLVLAFFACGCLLCPPYYVLKFFSFLLRCTFIRLRKYGIENIPKSGPVLLVSNHVSMIDMVLIQAVSPRRVRFMVHTSVVDFLPTRFIFKLLGVISVPNTRHAKAMTRFFEDIRTRLAKGEMVCIFPEGTISGNGNIMRFRSGVSHLLPQGVESSVIPVRIGMLRGRLFSIHQGKLRFTLPYTWPVDISIAVGTPVDPNLSAFMLRQRISELGADAEMGPQPGELPIHTAFIKQAKKSPFKKVFVDESGGVNNFEMLVRAILISKKVRELNQGGVHVGVLLPNSTAASSVTLGVLMADRTPAMINYSLGQDVALDSCQRAGIKTILTSRRFLDKIKWETTPEMICLEDVAPSITKSDKRKAILTVIFSTWRSLARKISPLSCFNLRHQAVLLFSSGSTGKPKAVMLTHRNLNCDIYAFIRVIAWTPQDRIAGNLPLFHAYGFMIGVAFPSVGNTLVAYVLNPLDSAGVVRMVAKNKITILTATPTFLQSYMRKAEPKDFATLRLMITGAEKLRPELAARYRENFGRDIIEGYGCTELSPIVTINLNNSIFDLGTRADRPGSIGCGLPSIHIRIVDQETGVELEPGIPGRMQVKAGIVMKGYLNDPEQTALVLQNGYYDTGDIAYMDPDGYIYITGRASRFSKIGGEMVPHEGVEEAIMGIRKRENREVAVMGKPDPKKGEKLVVFYAADDFIPEQIVDEMRKLQLPNLWIPKPDDFIEIDELPILGSGKLNLRKLKELVNELN